MSNHEQEIEELRNDLQESLKQNAVLMDELDEARYKIDLLRATLEDVEEFARKTLRNT